MTATRCLLVGGPYNGVTADYRHPPRVALIGAKNARYRRHNGTRWFYYDPKPAR